MNTLNIKESKIATLQAEHVAVKRVHFYATIYVTGNANTTSHIDLEITIQVLEMTK